MPKLIHRSIRSGVDPEFGKWGVYFVDKVEDQRKKEISAMVREGSSNITTKLKYILLSPFIVSQINYTA